MKTLWWRPSPIAPGNIWICFISDLFSIICSKFYLHQEVLHYYRHWIMLLVVLLMMRVFSVFLWSSIDITLIRSHHPCNRHWSRISVLRTTATVLKTCLNMLRAFKWLLNEIWLETKWSEVMLIWWFASIKFIRSFLKFPFLICFFKRFPL